MFVSLSIGQINIPIKNILAIILVHCDMESGAVGAFSKEQEAVIWFIRMPRLIIGILVGSGLAISGAVLQGLFHNPLVDPGITGVSAGAALGAVLAIALGLAANSIFIMPIFASLGSIIAVFLTIFLSWRKGNIPIMTLLLAGVVVGMFLGAITSSVLMTMSETKLQSYLFWLIGGLDYSRWEHVQIAFLPITFGIAILFFTARQLNILALGDVEAKSVGMRVLPLRLGILLIAAIVTATGVCVSGNIGFVGLVVPHMMRILVGPDYRLLLPITALAGAIFLTVCDLLGRIVMPPMEIRVGIMTSLLGAPYFLFLLRKMQRKFF